MKLKRTIFFSLALVMFISLCGCDTTKSLKDTISNITADKTEVDPGIDSVGFTIPYLRADSLNPYKAKETINKNIGTLLYDSLFSVDNSFKAQPLIAENYTNKDKTLTVTIKTGLTFTDGALLTADDVVYSFKLAKDSSNFSSFLKNIKSATADGTSQIVFTLSNANIYEASNLIFPIVEKNTGEDKNSSDDYSSTIPVGSGRYAILSTNDSRILTVNKARLGGYHPKYNSIGLKDVTEISSISNLFSIGDIDFYTDDFSEGTYTRYTGTSAKFNLTNFVYIGINSKTKVLSDSKTRRAIALIINRNDLASVSFAGNAVATSSPFHPSFYALSDCTLPPIKNDVDAGISLLEEAGYDKVSESGIRYSDSGKLELRLLVNKDNSFKLSMARSIQQSLGDADISVVLKEYSYSNYVSAVQSGSYDLYIGEAKMNNNFDLSAFFTSDGGLDYGIDEECASEKAYNQLESGKITMQNFLDEFADDLPIIPVAYRNGITIRSKKIITDSKAITSDCFYNIDEWTTE